MNQTQLDQLSLLERAVAPTPKLFRILRLIGLALAAASGALLAAPVALPAIVTTVAGYVAIAGTVATAVSLSPAGGGGPDKGGTGGGLASHVSPLTSRLSRFTFAHCPLAIVHPRRLQGVSVWNVNGNSISLV